MLSQKVLGQEMIRILVSVVAPRQNTALLRKTVAENDGSQSQIAKNP
jgi:hypothetical protein